MTIQNSLSPLIRSHRPLRTVLIGTSLGEESDHVVRAGLAAARAAGAQVYLVHAVEPRRTGFEVGAGSDLEREQIAWWEKELRRQVQRFGVGELELAGTQVRAGVPNRVIVHAAQQIGAGLIVVGATGSGPLAAELLGSTADRVLRKAACPVLVVRGELHVPPRKVLAPVDLSTLSGDPALRAAEPAGGQPQPRGPGGPHPDPGDVSVAASLNAPSSPPGPPLG